MEINSQIIISSTGNPTKHNFEPTHSSKSSSDWSTTTAQQPTPKLQHDIAAKHAASFSRLHAFVAFEPTKSLDSNVSRSE